MLLSSFVFCHQHQKQLPEIKDINIHYYSNIGFFPLEIEQIIADFCDPGTYLTLIIYNPMLHKTTIYTQKHILFKEQILYNFNEQCESKFKLLLSELNEDIQKKKSKDYLYQYYTESKMYKYKTFKYDISLIGENALANDILIQKKIGTLDLLTIISNYQNKCRQKILDLIDKVYYL